MGRTKDKVDATWRGRSYRKGAKRVRALREADAARADRRDGRFYTDLDEPVGPPVDDLPFRAPRRVR